MKDVIGPIGATTWTSAASRASTYRDCPPTSAFTCGRVLSTGLPTIVSRFNDPGHEMPIGPRGQMLASISFDE
jgi:hypothetical protein